MRRIGRLHRLDTCSDMRAVFPSDRIVRVGSMSTPNSPNLPDGGFTTSPAAAMDTVATPRPRAGTIDLDVGMDAMRLPELLAVFTAMVQAGLLQGLRVDGVLRFSSDDET
jgi:hypothetical protein